MSAAAEAFALDGGWQTLAEAEHGLHHSTRGLPVEVACTHFVPGSRVVVTVTPAAGARAGAPGVPGGDTLATAAPEVAALLEQHVQRHSGRAVVFPGAAALTGTLRVADLLARTAIDAVVLIGGATAGAAEVLDTQDHVRPEFVAGRLLLRARPAARRGAGALRAAAPDAVLCRPPGLAGRASRGHPAASSRLRSPNSCHR